MELIDIAPADLETVQHILLENAPGLEVRAFGSRVSWTARETSDLDLALMTNQPMSIARMAKLKAAFTESDLPFRVEVVDWASTSESFRKIIEKKYVAISASLVGGPGNLTANLKVVPSEWRELAFSEAIQLNPAVPLDRGVAYPFIDMAALNAGSRTTYPSGQREFRGGGSKFRSGDTLMARITPCLENGKISRYQASDSTEVAHGSTEFIVIRGRPEVTDNDFTYYLTQWEEVRNYAIDQMTGTSGRQRVPTDSFNHLIVSIPPLPEQRAIAHVLGTLDDKIELNRRMNETLEEMARALFKSWFVDFDPVHAKAALKNHSSSNSLTLKKGKAAQGGEWIVERAHAYLDRMDPNIAALFPDRFVDSELSKIPEGWEVGTIDQLATVAGGTTPSTKNRSYWENGTHYWATPKDLSTLSTPVLLRTERKITDAGLAKIGSGLLPCGTVLLSSRAPIGYLAIAEIPVAINQGFIAILPSRGVSNLFLLYWIEASREEIVNYANGSTFLEISKSNFRQLILALPRRKVMAAFERHIRPLHDCVVSNEHESRNLVALRDALLPKLVSGELRVSGFSMKAGQQ